jgi:hypothetical protein
MAIFEVLDIVKVPFPYTDRPVRQRRPALVVASDRSQKHSTKRQTVPAMGWVERPVSEFPAPHVAKAPLCDGSRLKAASLFGNQWD